MGAWESVTRLPLTQPQQSGMTPPAPSFSDLLFWVLTELAVEVLVKDATSKTSQLLEPEFGQVSSVIGLFSDREQLSWKCRVAVWTGEKQTQ